MELYPDISVVSWVMLSHVAMRVVLSAAPFKSSQSPGRVVSAVQGAVVALLLAADRAPTAVGLSLGYFVLDCVLNVLLRGDVSAGNLAHHAAGAALCAYACSASSYELGHPFRGMTLGFIWMEATNPALQAAVLCKTECGELWQRGPLRAALSALVLVSWVWLRLWGVAAPLGALLVAPPLELQQQAWLILPAAALLGLNVFWFGVLISRSVQMQA